jgi:hypothetical protein
MGGSYDELADRLDAISEDLADAAIGALSAAARRGDRSRPATEKTVTQARRAVEKAAHLLRSIDADAASDELH